VSPGDRWKCSAGGYNASACASSDDAGASSWDGVDDVQRRNRGRELREAVDRLIAAQLRRGSVVTVWPVFLIAVQGAYRPPHPFTLQLCALPKPKRLLITG